MLSQACLDKPGPRFSTRRKRHRNATGIGHTILEAVLPDSRGMGFGARQLDPVCTVR